MSECVFCKIINGEISAKIVGENEHAIAFLDAFPLTNGHTLVIPKKHHLDLATCNQEELRHVISLVQDVARKIEACKHLNPWGMNYLSNQGKIAGQEIMHFHFHIIPKYDTNFGLKSGAQKSNDLEDINTIYQYLKK